ncbi:MAG: DUF721 domain-containing protein [Caldiserica bacterium]|nr:DUF721 domain-containing protein [Caldisericota bacterium]MDH7562128.1 DUF721 domain-containing protein [Caldisericota bacterium]
MQGKRKRALKPISELLGPVVSSLGLKERLLEEEVKMAWVKCLPEVWKEHVFFRGFRKGVLLVSCSSSSWAQEVRFNSPELKKKINATLKRELVSELKTAGLTKRG